MGFIVLILLFREAGLGLSLILSVFFIVATFRTKDITSRVLCVVIASVPWLIYYGEYQFAQRQLNEEIARTMKTPTREITASDPKKLLVVDGLDEYEIFEILDQYDFDTIQILKRFRDSSSFKQILNISDYDIFSNSLNKSSIDAIVYTKIYNEHCHMSVLMTEDSSSEPWKKCLQTHEAEFVPDTDGIDAVVFLRQHAMKSSDMPPSFSLELHVRDKYGDHLVAYTGYRTYMTMKPRYAR